jgi:hypothetical protein
MVPVGPALIKSNKYLQNEKKIIPGATETTLKASKNSCSSADSAES